MKIKNKKFLLLLYVGVFVFAAILVFVRYRERLLCMLTGGDWVFSDVVCLDQYFFYEDEKSPSCNPGGHWGCSYDKIQY